MLVLDTEYMRRDLRKRGMDEKQVEDITKRFEIYEGVEVRMYADSNHGFMTRTFRQIEIPKGWCRYERGRKV